MSDKIEFTKSSRSAISANLADFCYFGKLGDFVEVTEWTNCEGYDIHISRSNGDALIQLTHGELRAINALVGAV